MISTKYLCWKLIPRESPDAGAVWRGVRHAESGLAGRGFPTLIHSDLPSKWEVCSRRFLNCLVMKRSYFRGFCENISAFVVGMLCLMFSNAIFFLMIWVSVWCRNDWNYDDQDNFFDQKKRVNFVESNTNRASYSQVPIRTENYSQPVGGTPDISRGPNYQRFLTDNSFRPTLVNDEDNEYFCDDQISNIRALEAGLTDAEKLRKSKKRQFSVNESLVPRSSL